MKKLFARLFGPRYIHEVVLPNGQQVTMTSRAPFTTEDVANHLRPAPRKGTKFLRVLPWVLVDLLVIGLSVSIFFNIKQHQTITYLESVVESYQDSVEDWQDYYQNLEDDYNQYVNDAQDTIDYYQDEAEQYLADSQDLVDQLYGLYDTLDQFDYDVDNVKSDLYYLWSDKYYNNVNPSADNLDAIYNDTCDLDDSIERVATELANYLNNR
jgi:hypothetical protein